MKGLYVYCIRTRPGVDPVQDKVGTDTEFSVKGIDGEKVQTLVYKDLEAVVSEVCFEKFDSAEIKKKAQEDLRWIREKVQLHEEAVEQAMKKEGRIVSVIPMKFGTIFKTKEKLEETLKRYYSKFKTSLEELAGKHEWGVKVYLNQKSFKEGIKKVSSVVREKEKELASLPKERPIFYRNS